MEPWAGSPDIDPLRVVRIPEHNRVARTSTDGTQPKYRSRQIVLLSLDTRTLMDVTSASDWTYVESDPVRVIILNV